MKYFIERLGDIKGKTFHNSLEDCFDQLKKEYPVDEYGDQTNPDPEDDRILIWEILDTGHAKVVWHFSGWHWDADEFGLEQGALPGHEKSWYSEALADY